MNIYIVELEPPRERLEVQYVPSEISISRSANISTVNVVGLNIPLRQWTGGEKSLNFTLNFYAKDEAKEEAVRKVKWLESLTYNENAGNPRLVKVVFNRLFLDDKWIVDTVNYKLANFHPTEGYPVQAEVSLSLLLYARGNEYNFNRVRKNF